MKAQKIEVIKRLLTPPKLLIIRRVVIGWGIVERVFEQRDGKMILIKQTDHESTKDKSH